MRAPRQLDLEVVVAEAARVAQDGVGRPREVLRVGRRAVEQRLGFAVAPGLWATPPRARRASVIVPPSISRAAATETSAKA